MPTDPGPLKGHPRFPELDELLSDPSPGWRTALEEDDELWDLYFRWLQHPDSQKQINPETKERASTKEKAAKKPKRKTNSKAKAKVEPVDDTDDELVDDADYPVPLGTFLDTVDDTYDWLIPLLLERGDRFVYTGGEGDGKSTLIAQFGVQSAAGIHPTTGEPMKAIRVMMVDLENGTRHVRREIGKMAGLLTDEQLQAARSNLYIRSLPEGFDLSTDVDQGRLEAWCEEVDPDLLLIGPRYKMLGNEDDKVEAKETQRFLDRIRVRYGCIIGSESHSPHASNEDGSRVTREYGTSKWLRWPEFGMHLRRDGAVSHYRGPRDPDRPWPSQWDRNEEEWAEGTGWPWLPMAPGVIKIEMTTGGVDRTVKDRLIGLQVCREIERGKYDDRKQQIASRLHGSNPYGRGTDVMKWMREEGLVDTPGYVLNSKGEEALEELETG